MRDRIDLNPDHEYAHLYDLLESSRSKGTWTPQEDQLMLDWFKSHPNEHRYSVPLAEALREKRSFKQIEGYIASLRYGRIANPTLV